jgi:hypothetical protein
MTSLRSAFVLPFLGERRKGERRALLVAGRSSLPKRPGPESLLQREKDRKRGWNSQIHPAPFSFYPSPQDDPLRSAFFPFLGERLGGRRFARVKRTCPPLPKRPGPSPLPGEGGTGWVDKQRLRRPPPCGIPPRRISVRDAAPRKARKTGSAGEGGEPTGTR